MDTVAVPLAAVAMAALVVGGATERSDGNHWIVLLVTGVVSVARVVANKGLVLVVVSSGSGLLFSVSVVDSFSEVLVETTGTRVGFETVLESLITGRLVGVVNVEEEIKSTGRETFVGSGPSVDKVGILDKMLDKISVGAVLLIGRGNMEAISVGKIDCKVEVIPDTIGRVTMSISKKKGKINITRNSPYHLRRPQHQ